MRRDEAFLLDILIAARKARQFLTDISWEQFTESELHQGAVVRLLEVVGEAASRISAETREAHPEIACDQMIGMRNRLIHEYFRVNVRTVWETAQHDLPRLVALIEPLVPREDEV